MIDSLSGKGTQKQPAQRQVQRKVVQEEVAARQKEVTGEEADMTSPWALGFQSMFGGSQQPVATTTNSSVQETPIRRPQGTPSGKPVNRE